MTSAETARIVGVIRAAIPNAPAIGRDTVAAWHDILGDLPFEAVLKATRTVLSLQEIPAFPAVGKIRREAVMGMRPRVATAAEAWGRVVAEIRHATWYGQPDGLDPLTRRVVDAIGWRNICESTEAGVERGQFLRMYAEMAEKAERDAVLPEELRAGAPPEALPNRVREGLSAIGSVERRVIPIGGARK